MQQKLNEIGDEGWDLVAFKGEQFIFKRPTSSS